MSVHSIPPAVANLFILRGKNPDKHRQFDFDLQINLTDCDWTQPLQTKG
jgi:hypothetical protein